MLKSPTFLYGIGFLLLMKFNLKISTMEIKLLKRLELKFLWKTRIFLEKN